MATKIVVPDAGQTTDELLLVKWHVAVGDDVAAGDLLADIETDKAVAELESHATGQVLKLMAEEGDTVETGQTLLWIGAPGEQVDEATAPGAGTTPAEQAVTPEDAAPTPTSPAPAGTLATPAARTAAREHGVDVKAVAGTGPAGCVVKRDVAAFPTRDHESLRGTRVPLSSMRRALAVRLQQSVREAPHFYVTVEVDMTRALAVRQAAEPRVTLNDVIVKAAADMLAEFPRLNCRLEADAIHYLEDINIGIAVSVDDGLVVPVVAGADKRTLAEVAERARSVVASARAGRLAAGAQSTFTVSNLGMYGVKSFTAIINPPEAAVLAVGAVEDKLTLTAAGIVAVPTICLTLSADHRLVDGALAARFLAALKDRLANAPQPAK